MSEGKLDVGQLTALWRGTLVELLGIEFVELAPERVLATLAIRDDLRTVGGALHGGTLMAFADTVGAVATVLNLPAGAGTTTLESKTNFFAAGRSGTVRAETHAAPSRQADHGLADARHRRVGPHAVADHPDPDGPRVKVAFAGAFAVRLAERVPRPPRLFPCDADSGRRGHDRPAHAGGGRAGHARLHAGDGRGGRGGSSSSRCPAPASTGSTGRRCLPAPRSPTSTVTRWASPSTCWARCWCSAEASSASTPRSGAARGRASGRSACRRRRCGSSWRGRRWGSSATAGSASAWRGGRSRST